MNKGLLSVDEALEVLLAGARPVAQTEQVDTLQATGRVLAAAQASTMDVPPMDNSAMDGYALRTADLSGPDTRLRVAQRIPAGAVGTPLAQGTAARIFTGAPIPEGADAVAMQEFCAPVKEEGGDFVLVKKPPQPEEWIRRRASDIRTGGTVLEASAGLFRSWVSAIVTAMYVASTKPQNRMEPSRELHNDTMVMYVGVLRLPTCAT